MDSLEALNIVPFLGLMNLVEVRYLHMPEVYRTMLAILCDYDPLSQDNITKTRRYLSLLLAREPELAQCLLNFIDTPEEPVPTSAHPHASADSASDAGEHKHCQQGTSQERSAQLADEQLAENMQKGSVPVPQRMCSEEMTSFQSLEQRDVPASDCKSKGFTSTPSLAPGQGQTYPQTGSVFPEAPKPLSLHPPACEPGTSYSSHMSKSVPQVNIYHKHLFAPEKSSSVVPKTDPPQAAPFCLPGFLMSHADLSSSAGFRHAGRPLLTGEHRDQFIFTPDLTFSHGQTGADENSAAHLKQVTGGSSNKLKNDKHCSVVQTQTLPTSENRTNLPQGSAPFTETTVPFKLVRSTTAASSTEALMTMATSGSQPCTPDICLSKLLGQPSVAYLPPGHLVENRSSVVGTAVCKPTSAEKLPYSSSVLSGKMNSAAAKLHLLSTQAGNEKSVSIQAGCRKATSSVTSNLMSTSASVLTAQKDSTMRTTMKFTSKPGCKKTITLSRIVPVLKLDTVTGQNTKTNTMSYDKQVQVGQRQICKMPTAGNKIQAHQLFSDTKQLENNPNSQENSNGGQLTADWKRDSKFHPLAGTTGNDSTGKSKKVLKETQPLSVSQQKCPVTKKQRATKQKPQHSTMSLEGQSGSLSLEGQIESEVTTTNDEKQVTEQLVEKQEHLLPEAHGNQNMNWSQEDKNWMSTSHALLPNKYPQKKHVTTINPAPSRRQKVQVVAVSMDTSQSLSAFPYIQQMVLPDGQVSTIAHNAHTPTASHQRATEQRHEAATISAKSPATAGVSHSMQESRSPSSKPTAQIVLPRSQLKLSVSIQTPAANCNSASRKKPKTITGHSDSLRNPGKKMMMKETDQTSSEVITPSEQDTSCKPDEEDVLADATNLLSDALATGNKLGKRKRSPSCKRKVVAKTL